MKHRLSIGILPFRNMRAHPVRSIILLLLSLTQAACMLGGLGLMIFIRQEMAAAESRLGADILIYPSAAMSRISSKTLLMQGSPVEVWKDRSMLSRMKDCDGIQQLAYQLYIRDTAKEKPVWIVGYEPEQDFVISPWVQEGSSQNLPDGALLIGCNVELTDGRVNLFKQLWPVGARLAETDSELDEMVFANPETFRLLIEAAGAAGITDYASIDPSCDYSVALLRVRERKNLDSITSWLNTYIRKVKAVHSEETLSETASGVHSQIGLVSAVSVASWAVLLLALGITQSMMMKERRKELYILYSVGASCSVVKKIMLKEALVIHGTGAALGVFAGIGFLHFLIHSSFMPSLCLTCALLTVCLSVLSGCIGMTIALRRATASMSGQMLLTA